MSSHSIQWSLRLVALAMLCCAGAAQADVGARVVVQAWNPMVPDQQNVVTLVDEPSLVSDSLREAWTAARPKICAQIKARMGAGGAANGETLYDITCLLDEEATLEITGAQNALQGTFTVGGYLEATSTTPTPLGSYADPRVSVSLRARLDLVLAVQSDPDRTLRVTRARFTLGNASLDSHNAVADVLEFVAEDLIPFFKGPNFKRQAEDAVNAIAIDLAAPFDAALAPVNAKLKGPSDAVRVGVAANSTYINVAFAPRQIAPPGNGSMSGVLRWDPTQFAPRNGCQSFDIRATVQTGPVPMYAANAEAPTRQVGSFQTSAASPSACTFTMTGLAAGWPHTVSARVIDGSAVRSPGSSIYGVSYSLAGDGWDGRNVTPNPVASPRDYRVARSLDATAVVSPDYSSMQAQVAKKADPRINPSGVYAAQKAINRTDAVTGASDTARIGDTVGLNPQPLPPGPPEPDLEAQSQTRVQAAGTNAGIIIVSGRNDGAFASKTPGLSQISASRVDPAVIAAAKAQVRSGDAVDLDALAARGPAIAAADPLAMELREQQVGAALRGFDIGMAAAEGQTAPGPGKDRIRASLPAAEQGGFLFAVAFTLDRNRNAERAATGAAIAAADPETAAARAAQPDVLHRLGFDIATAIFGDPALGAQGNTATGPGSMGIRNALSPSALQGFDDGVAFHLRRTYAR